ncbi:MAG: cysteine desulfurase [Acidobacteriota bacterium]|nr:cysteine desulfurase [Acidobacteriota bacterium]MDH3784302.1 cysteine desulfurase [Acidobacteriota bacterium]
MSNSGPVYLDHNSTTPMATEVYDAMLPVLREDWGNPSSQHAYGFGAREHVETARREVAALLGADPSEILFTSGGTESDNAAVIGVAEALRDRGKHIVTTRIEHAAVEEPCAYLEGRGWEITRLGVDSDGRVSVADARDALRDDTTLVSVMHANNETGVLQPVAEIGGLARERGIPFHTDAAQSVGKLPVHVEAFHADLLTIAGHKFYGPKGVGALYLRAGTPFEPFLRGAGHESGQRAGTENTAAIVGLGVACRLARMELPNRTAHLTDMRDRLENGLRESLPQVVVHGGRVPRLPNTSSLAIPGCDANALLSLANGVAGSAGAACHAGKPHVSRTLRGMGVTDELAMATMRLTVGCGTTADQIRSVVDELTRHAQAITRG